MYDYWLGGFFDGFDLVDPGLVYMPQWRPDSPADVPSDPSKLWALVGAGRVRWVRAGAGMLPTAPSVSASGW